MSPALNRRAALGAGLATLMPAPPPACFLATPANVALGLAAATAPLASLDAVAAVPEVAARATPDGLRRGGERLPDHAALWARMPLPFTPAQAWHLLAPEVQAEIGAAVIGMALADYVSGDMHMDEADHFLDGDLRSDCIGVRDESTGGIEHRLWALMPDLYGPDGDHPRWALDAGMVLPLADTGATS